MPENLPGKLRLFVAIAIPEAVRMEMAAVQRQLMTITPAVRWTSPEQMHLTLKFFGDVPVERVAQMKETLARACHGTLPFPLTAQGIGFFPNHRAPRVIWVGIECANDFLTILQRKIEDAFSGFKEKDAPERFVAHATLGRIKDPQHRDIKDLVTQSRSFQNKNFGEWPVRDVGLIQSELSSTGSRYTAIASVPLA